MNREHHKWYSPSLGRDMELLIFGHGGSPYIVFPTSMGSFYEYENRGMIDAAWDKYEHGQVQAFCVDSVDRESWYNKDAHPYHRVRRHEQYERYILNEVVPLVRQRNWGPIGTTGCSFGGYHAANFAFRNPGIIAQLVSMSGAFDTKQFLKGYYDENCYFNCPVDYLPNTNDWWYLDQYRRMRIVLGAGDWDICLGENQRMSGILGAKAIPHWLDVWGDRVKHDWPLWHGMARKFL
jgi:esterase/lipase superfamily enzyme